MGGGGVDWGTTPGNTAFPVPVALPASFPGTGGTGYMGEDQFGVAPGPLPISLAMGWYDSAIIVSPNGVDNIFVGGQETDTATATSPGHGDIFESTDGGVTWVDISTENGSGPKSGVHSFAFNAKGQLVVGTDGGVWIFDDTTNPAAPTWIDVNGDLSDSLVNSASPNPTVPGNAIAGLQENGVAVSTGSAAWLHTDGADLGGGQVLFDPKNANIAYAINVVNTGIQVTPVGVFAIGTGQLDKSTDGGNTWTISGFPPFPSSPLSVLNPLIQNYLPLVVDPINDSRLLIGGFDVDESLDGGATWNALGAPAAGLLNVTEIAAASFQGTFVADPSFPQVTDLGSNTYDPDTVYVVGLKANPFPPPAFIPGLEVTKNHGLTWVDRTPGGIGNISAIAVDPSNRDTVYVVTNTWGGPRILESTDAGQTWVDVSGSGTTGLPALPIWSARRGRAARSRQSTWAMTANGVWLAVGGGSGATTAWQRFGAGLPYVQVTSLVLNTALNTLTAGTYGRSVYQLSLSDVPTNGTYGALRAAAGDSTWNGPIKLVGDPATNAVAIGAAGTQFLADGVSTASLTVFGTISDLVPGSNPNLNKVGQGDVILSGANTYGGVTEIKEGQLIVHAPLALGASTVGPNEVQVIDVSGAGTFALTFNGQSTPTSGPGVLSATDPSLATDMQNALNALTTIGGVGGAVNVTLTPNGFMVYFGGTLAGSPQSLLTVTVLTGAPTVIVNENTFTTEVQGITVAGTPASFPLTFNGATTTNPVPYSATVGATTSTIGATITNIAPYPNGATESGNIVTITTTTPNDLVAGQMVVIGGIFVFGVPNPFGYDGTFMVTSVPTPTTFTYTDAANPGLPTAGGGTVTPVVFGASESGTTVTITTTAAHDLVLGQSVVIAGVPVAAYNGTFTITAVTPTSFQYTPAINVPAAAVSGSGTTVTVTVPNNFIAGETVVIAGLTPASFDGTFTVASANGSSFTYANATVGASTTAGTATPSGLPSSGGSAPVNLPGRAVSGSGTTVTVTIPNNFTAGEMVVISGLTPASFNGTFTIVNATSSSFTYANTTSGTSTTAGTAGAITGFVTPVVPGASEVGSTVTITTTAPHGFAIGQSITLAGVPALGYDGTFTITSVPSPTSFTYTDAATGLPNSGGGGVTLTVASTAAAIQNALNGVTATITPTGATESGTTVTITTTAAHGFAIGQTVVIAGVAAAGYNGTYLITGITPTTFTYTAAARLAFASGRRHRDAPPA